MRIETETLYRLTERKETAQLATIIKSDRVNQLRAAFTKVETEHTRLTAMLSSTHPRLSELSTAKNTARQRLEQEFASIVSKLEAEYIAALNTETILQKVDTTIRGSSQGCSPFFFPRPKKKNIEENYAEAEVSSHQHPQGEENNEQQSMSHAQKLKALLETAIQTTTIEGLSLLACGQVWSDPEEQLVSRTMQEVLRILRRQFDCVLIDSPAATTYGDAELLSQLTDATILVIRGHKTPMAAAHRIAGQLQAVHANVLGVVLTNVTPFGTTTTNYLER